MQKYRRLLKYAGPQGRFLVLISVLTLAASALVAAQPWPIKWLADHVLGQAPLPAALQRLLGTFSLAPTPTAVLALVVVGGLVLFALHSLLEVGLTWAWTLSGRRMVYSLAEELFARLQRRSPLFHSRSSVGDTMGRVTTDSWCVYHVMDTLLFAPGHALLTTVLLIILMAQVDATLTLWSLVIAPFMVVASFLVGKPLRAAARLKREIETRIQSHIQQTLTGIPVVQSFVHEDREQERFRRFADVAIAAQQRSTLIGSVNSLSSGFITTLGTGVILFAGARSVAQGQLSLGNLLAFLFWFGLLQTQMKVFADIYTKLQGFSASVDRVMEVLDAKPEVADQPGAIPLPPVRGSVQLQNITFGYEPGRPVLRNLSLEARPGQTLAIVGSTGAGKSTLVSLILRFFDPWDGRVLVDGHDVRDVELKTLRAQIAIVLQEPFLFPLSVADNIAYGRPDASRAEIKAAARDANADDFISRLPQGYDTIIGERGATLSGGERQRLSIARALLKNTPILI